MERGSRRRELVLQLRVVSAESWPIDEGSERRPLLLQSRRVSDEHLPTPAGSVVELLHQAYPQWDIPRLAHPDDDGNGALNEWVGWQDGEAYFCSKNLASIGIELRDPEGSLLDMAEAMLAHGVVQPKPRQKDEL